MRSGYGQACAEQAWQQRFSTYQKWVILSTIVLIYLSAMWLFAFVTAFTSGAPWDSILLPSAVTLSMFFGAYMIGAAKYLPMAAAAVGLGAMTFAAADGATVWLLLGDATEPINGNIYWSIIQLVFTLVAVFGSVQIFRLALARPRGRETSAPIL